MTSSDIEHDEKIKTPNKLLQLPMARVKTIMRSSPDLGNVSQDGYFMITKATELFVQYLAVRAYEETKKENHMDYNSLSKLVQTDESLEFLEEIIPAKIKAWEYWKRVGYTPEPKQKINTPKRKKSSSPVLKSVIENTTKSPTSPKAELTKKPETIVID